MSAPFSKGDFVSFLAPMQDITDAGFMDIIAGFGAPDFFMAEYFRVHEYFYLEPSVLEAVLRRPAGRGVVAQFIGEDEYYIERAIDELARYPQVEMLDLNLGCPAPKIYKKNVGGGLLRDPKKIESILRVMRERWRGVLSVKMRLGFEDDSRFFELFRLVCDCGADFVTVHGRTVRQLYRGRADYGRIFEAAESSPVPVIVNGDVDSADVALEIRAKSKCAGVMSGRPAVRNPWIFRQIREALDGRKIFEPTLEDVRVYVEKLRKNIEARAAQMKFPDSRLKKFLNFAGTGVDPEGEFLYKMRRSRGMKELLKVCDEFLLGENAAKKFNCAGFANLCARPNHEADLRG